MGIGRSNGFIQTFTCALALSVRKYLHNLVYRTKNPLREWSPIIPNSQLIVQAAVTEADDWTLELFVSPTKQLYLIILTLVGALILILIGIIIIHAKEQKQDKKLQQSAFSYF